MAYVCDSNIILASSIVRMSTLLLIIWWKWYCCVCSFPLNSHTVFKVTADTA